MSDKLEGRKKHVVNGKVAKIEKKAEVKGTNNGFFSGILGGLKKVTKTVEEKNEKR